MRVRPSSQRRPDVDLRPDAVDASVVNSLVVACPRGPRADPRRAGRHRIVDRGDRASARDARAGSRSAGPPAGQQHGHRVARPCLQRRRGAVGASAMAPGLEVVVEGSSTDSAPAIERTSASRGRQAVAVAVQRGDGHACRRRRRSGPRTSVESTAVGDVGVGLRARSSSSLSIPCTRARPSLRAPVDPAPSCVPSEGVAATARHVERSPSRSEATSSGAPSAPSRTLAP